MGRPMKRTGPRHDLVTKLEGLRNKEEYGLKDIEVTKQKVAGLKKQAKVVKQQSSKVILDVLSTWVTIQMLVPVVLYIS